MARIMQAVSAYGPNSPSVDLGGKFKINLRADVVLKNGVLWDADHPDDPLDV
jgi:hypothetical protein